MPVWAVRTSIVSDENPTPEPEAAPAPQAEPAPSDGDGADDTAVGSTEFVEPPTLVEPPAEPAADVAAAVAAPTPVVEEPAAPTEAEPVVATPDPAAVETAATVPAAPVATEHRVVYVEAPRPPRRRGNRGFGFLIAIFAAIVYAAVYAVAALIIFPVWAPGQEVAPEFSNFLGSTVFWVPILYFFVFFVALILLANRAGWWVYVLMSNVVALIVYFGSIGVFLLQSDVIHLTQPRAGRLFVEIATQPFVVTCGLLALELTIWAGLIVATRGRRIRAKNAEARDAWEHETTDTTPDNGMFAP